jgi:hypothetical protein
VVIEFLNFALNLLERILFCWFDVLIVNLSRGREGKGGDALGWYVVALSGLRKKCPSFWECGL